jgi:tRNA 5-methylaminomethyl-2-thiouridine biosynthesis bifunctional protein
MTSITHAQLAWNELGTPVSDQFDDVYFSNVNGLEETRYVFLQQNQLPERWVNSQERRFVIAETGFGTGLNFLAAWQNFDMFRQQNPDSPLKELHFISFEKYPVNKKDLIKAHLAWPELASYATQLHHYYPIAVPECHRIILADGLITLDLWFGDIRDCMPLVATKKEGIIDAWFLDGFAPSKNPEMWNQNLFDNMAKLAKQSCTCATFTAAGFVRRGLLEAGFDVKKVKGFGTKREMIAGKITQKIDYSNIPPWFHYQATPALKDIAIIGGGIASATLAKTLTRRGYQVTLYCADESPAEGASGNRQGAVYPLLTPEHNATSRVFAPAFLFARQFIAQCALDFTFSHQWCGVTQLMWDEVSSTKLHKFIDSGFNPELLTILDKSQTDEIVGLPCDMDSIYYPLGGWISPAQLTGELLNHLNRLSGCSVKYDHKIEDIKWNVALNTWQLSTKQTVFEHQTVVIANGHQFDQFIQTTSLPLAKVKGQVSHIPTTTRLEKLRSVLCYDGYMTPFDPSTQQHCIGASYDRTHIDNVFDQQAQAENKQKLVDCITNQSWTSDVNITANQSRQGVRCVSRDHLPFIGNIGQYQPIKSTYSKLHQQTEAETENLPIYPNLYAFIGLGSRGLSSAPLMAELLASIMSNDPLPLAADLVNNLNPSRMWIRKLRKGKTL